MGKMIREWVTEGDRTYLSEYGMCKCGDTKTAEWRYVWNLPYEIACDECWANTATAETEGRSYDYLYAGEYYEDDY